MILPSVVALWPTGTPDVKLLLHVFALIVHFTIWTTSKLRLSSATTPPRRGACVRQCYTQTAIWESTMHAL